MKKASEYPDVVQTILARPCNGIGGGPNLLDIRSQGYGDDDLWDGLTTDDVLEDSDTVFVWAKWEPLELWP